MQTNNNYTDFEKKQAKKMANYYLFSTQNILLGKSFKYDRRTRIGYLAAQIVRKNQLSSEQKKQILEKRKIRFLRKPQNEKTIFETPILKDYMINKHNLKGVYENRLEFWNRNHWAKSNTKDFRILAILKKNYFKK